MKENIFVNSDCLTREQLLNYKAHNLSSEELRNIEKHLIDCPFCSDAVEGAETISIEEMKEDVDFVKGKIENHKKGRLPRAFLYSAVAALLLLAATAIFNISRPSNAEQLFKEYFEVYPDVTLHKRGLENSSKLTEAMNFYNKKRYKNASRIFSDIMQSSNNETAIFYNGISLIVLNRIDNALAELSKISNDSKNKFYYEANWYVALSLIYLNKIDEAKNHLLRLQNSSDYSKKANEVLKQFAEWK